MTTSAKFPLGQLLMTPGVKDLLNPIDIYRALARHRAGDWGDVPAGDARENDLSVKEGFRILSAYKKDGRTFWIITEADRSATTLLLPSEY